jgi:hypothetical protein
VVVGGDRDRGKTTNQEPGKPENAMILDIRISAVGIGMEHIINTIKLYS